MFKALSMGADLTQSARAFMLSIGCIHAQLCNTNTCPVGIATQNKKLMKGLNVEDKYIRCYNYHKNTVKAFLELMGATGAEHPSELRPSNLKRMAEDGDVWSYTEIIDSWQDYIVHCGRCQIIVIVEKYSTHYEQIKHLYTK